MSEDFGEKRYRCACGKPATTAVVYTTGGAVWGANPTCDEHLATFLDSPHGGEHGQITLTDYASLRGGKSG